MHWTVVSQCDNWPDSREPRVTNWPVTAIGIWGYTCTVRITQ